MEKNNLRHTCPGSLPNSTFPIGYMKFRKSTYSFMKRTSSGEELYAKKLIRWIYQFGNHHPYTIRCWTGKFLFIFSQLIEICSISHLLCAWVFKIFLFFRTYKYCKPYHRTCSCPGLARWATLLKWTSYKNTKLQLFWWYSIVTACLVV